MRKIASKWFLPSPSFSHAILDVEKGEYLGVAASFHDCCSMGERGGFAKARLMVWPERVAKDRGTARAKLRKNNIVKQDIWRKLEVMNFRLSLNALNSGSDEIKNCPGEIYHSFWD